MFGRRNRDEPQDGLDETTDDLVVDPELDVVLDDRIDDLELVTGAGDGTEGPFDVADAPDDGFARVDLGGLRVPAPIDSELRLEMNEAGQVTAATFVMGRSSLQISAFAAPRSEGIWQEVREEMLEGIRSAGGAADIETGSFGPELRAKVPEAPDKKALQPARFIGVDGPRWFLRGMFTGPAATDAGAAKALEGIFRGIVVVRGPDAMAPRDQLPLALPREAEIAMADADPTAPRRLPAPERGPEITEIQ
ncbi:MAG: hypothetical protein QOF57_155 [Frankiaceae bacterium]|jgi:hypothetical protein|nr:hypothetical protein [Frankiaceae bacterium]